MLEDLDPSTIEDAATRTLVSQLLNLLENALQENKLLKEENQHLRDEINRLKGEKGKPELKPAQKNYSSEKERHKETGRHKGSKQHKLVITRTEKLTIDRKTLPKDAEFKGYAEVIVQEVLFQTEVICFRKEKYYSPSTRQTYLAEMPLGYQGQYGPGLKALVIQLYHQSQVSEPKILELLTTFGVQISAGEISSWLIEEYQVLFEGEKKEIVRAGLESTSHQHFDHTGTRALGVNQACHIMCNPFYTAYFTLPQRDRVSVLQVLLGGEAPTYRYNEEAVRLLEQFKLAQKWRKRLEGLEWEREWSKAELTQWLKQHLPGIGKEGSKLVYDALAIAAYHGQQEWPVVQTLVCDDAPQFNYLTVELLLCWIHQGRPFKKLEPRLEYHRKILETFMGQFWNYYDQLLEYTREQREGQAERLEAEFDRIFQAGGEYEQLDAQILKVKANKAHLLLVLKNPKLPLHNNPAELGARQRVRKLDVSLSVFSEAGLAAWDCFQTILGTAKKLGVNTYAYLLDRISGKLALPSLASLIREKGQAGEYSYYPSEKSQKASQARRAKKGLGGRKAQTPLAVTPVSQPPPGEKATPEIKPPPTTRTAPLKQVMAF